jgi:hypothetical protein
VSGAWAAAFASPTRNTTLAVHGEQNRALELFTVRQVGQVPLAAAAIESAVVVGAVCGVVAVAVHAVSVVAPSAAATSRQVVVPFIAGPHCQLSDGHIAGRCGHVTRTLVLLVVSRIVAGGLIRLSRLLDVFQWGRCGRPTMRHTMP